LLTVTENGYGKRTDISEYLRGEEGGVQNRGGYGRKNYLITEKTGKVVDIKVVDDQDDVLIISDDGTIIRMAASDISLISRATQGVRLMRTQGESSVISIARTEKEEEVEEFDDEVTQTANATNTETTVLVDAKKNPREELSEDTKTE
jgi:DNA gyrase subunit A